MKKRVSQYSFPPAKILRKNASFVIIERDGGLLKTDAFEDGDKARIVAKRIPSRIHLQQGQPHIALVASSLQQRQGLVSVTESVIHQGDVYRRDVMLIG